MLTSILILVHTNNRTILVQDVRVRSSHTNTPNSESRSYSRQQHSHGNSTHTSPYESRTNAFVTSTRLSGRDLLNERSLDSDSTATVTASVTAAAQYDESVISNHDPDNSAEDVVMEEEDEPDEPFFTSSQHSSIASAAATGASMTRSDALAAIARQSRQEDRHMRHLSSSQSLFRNDNEVNEGRLSSSGHASLNSSLRSSSDRVFLGLNDPMTISNTISLTNSVMGLTGSPHTPVRHILGASPGRGTSTDMLGGVSTATALGFGAGDPCVIQGA